MEQDRYASTENWKRGEVAEDADRWYAPTSAGEQAANGGFLRTNKPAGAGEARPQPIRGAQPTGYDGDDTD